MYGRIYVWTYLCMNMSLHGSVICAIARAYMLAGAAVTPIRGCMEEYVCMYVAITIPCMYVSMYHLMKG